MLMKAFTRYILINLAGMQVSGTLTAVACSPIMAFRVKAPSLSLWRRRTYSRRTRLFLYAILSTLLISGAFTAVFLVAGVRSYNIGAMIDEAAGNRDGVGLALWLTLWPPDRSEALLGCRSLSSGMRTTSMFRSVKYRCPGLYWAVAVSRSLPGAIKPRIVGERMWLLTSMSMLRPTLADRTTLQQIFGTKPRPKAA